MDRLVSLMGVLLLAGLLMGCEAEEQALSPDCRDITAALSVYEFEEIKDLFLSEGDRTVIFNLYLENPHYSFVGFDAFLMPEVGPLNSRCDPAISDFNEIIIQEADPAWIYYRIVAVREGDTNNEDFNFKFLDGMMENRVYFVKYNDYDMDTAEAKVLGFATEMKNEFGI